MSEKYQTVMPGVRATLAMSMVPGTTLVNSSASDAVWISDSPAVAPGMGLRLGPLGSSTWTTPGVPVYACTDTGGVNPVSLTITDNMAPPVNPIDVATSTAAQLLAQGVPSVLTGKVVYNGLPVPTGLLPGGGYIYTIPGVDFTRYASVTVVLTNTNPYQCRVDFNDAATGVSFFGRSSVHSQGGTGTVTTLTANVTGGLLNLYISSLSVSNITVYASNRQAVTEGLMGGDVSLINTVASAAWGAGQPIPFGLFKSRGGLYTVRCSSGAAPATCKGYFGYGYQDWNGNNLFAYLLDTATAVTGVTGGTELRGQITLPPGLLALQWLNDPGAAHTYDIKLTLTAGAQ